jgi:hypothetical protein
MRRHDYSVHGYAGETIQSTDPDYIADPDPTNDLGVTVDGGGGGGSGTVGFASLLFLFGMATGSGTIGVGGGGSPTVGYRSLADASGVSMGNGGVGGGLISSVGFTDLLDLSGTRAAVPAILDYEFMVWTILPTLDGADRNVYVSSSTGNDSTGDGSIGAPFATIQKGITDATHGLRDLHGDRLLLKRGDTFTNVSGENIFGTWSKRGFDATRPMIVSAYGSAAVARPKINTGSSDFAAVSTGVNVHDVWFMDFEVYAGSYSHSVNPGPICFYWNGGAPGCDRMLWENVCIHDFGKFAFAFIGNGTFMTDFRVRGCTVYDIGHDSTGTDTTSGNYVVGVNGLVIEFYHGDTVGWLNPPSQSFLKRHWYIDNINGPTLPIVKNSQMIHCDPIQLRCGGTLTTCLVSDSVTGIYLGGGTVPTPGGVPVTCEDNVVLHSQDHTNTGGGAQADAWNLSMANIRDSFVRRNICASSSSLTGGLGLHFDTHTSSPPTTFICKDSEVSDNIFHNCGGDGLYLGGDTAWYSNVSLHDNVMQNPTNGLFYGPEHGITIYVNNANIVAPGDFVMANNRFGLAPGATQQCLGGAGTTFAAVFSHFSDTTSTGVGAGVAAANYLDPNRDIASYHGSIGGTATLAAYVARMKTMHRDDWDDRYTSPKVVQYMKEGFTEV